MYCGIIIECVLVGHVGTNCVLFTCTVSVCIENSYYQWSAYILIVYYNNYVVRQVKEK